MKISVITANYNYAQYIEEAINSIINQSYPDWELIIVDDGSSDNSVDIINSYCEKDNRIKFFQHPDRKNKGLKESLLLGLSHATGDWIAFLESDDYFYPDNLAKKIEIIEEHKDVCLIFNRVNFLEKNDKISVRQKGLDKTHNKLKKMKFPRDMFYDFYINNMILTFSCVMVKSEVIKNADFNTPVDTLLDWWLWIHLAHQGKFYYIDEKLTNWRLHQESYVLRGKKPILYTVQVQAYRDIYLKSGGDSRLLAFILFSSVILFFRRLYRFILRLPRRVRNKVRDIILLRSR